MAMERERIREKEEEPLEYYETDRAMKAGYYDRTEDRKHLATLPRTIRCAAPTFKLHKTPKGMGKGAGGEAAGVAHFIFPPGFNVMQMKYPIWTMTVFGHIGRALHFKEGASGCHRHWAEAIFYRMGGKYVEVQDGIEYQCVGEGALCIPSYTVHGHFYVEAPPKGSLTALSRIFDAIGASDLELFDEDPEYIKAGRPIGNFPILPDVQEVMYSRRKITRFEGEPKTTYDRFVKTVADENQWRMQCTSWIPADSMPWENTRFGKMKFLVHPWSKAPIRTLDCYIQEIPPGSRSGKHRHVHEEVTYCVYGKGYTMENEQRFDWEEDMLCCIPQGVTHQHFNADPHRPAKLYTVYPRAAMLFGHGGVEHLEDAPDYRP